IIKENKVNLEKKTPTFSLVPRLIEYKGNPLTCSGSQLKQIIIHCPVRLHVFEWKLYYSTHNDGISMSTFYSKCSTIDEFIIIIKDKSHRIFGAFIDSKLENNKDYRGTIDSFVFSFLDEKLNVYKSTGIKNYIMRSTNKSITIGAGECPALYIDCDFN